jgi:hypothetical protein
VVSVRVGAPVRKDEKAEQEGWPINTRLAIEDPFEVFYNVSHFLRQCRHRHIRMEFARAYTLCAQEADRPELGAGLLSRICEEAPPPAFLKTKEGEGEEEVGPAPEAATEATA